MPIYPRPMKLITNEIKSILYVEDLYLMDLTLHLSIHGIKNRTKIARPIAITPPSLSGIARRIA